MKQPTVITRYRMVLGAFFTIFLLTGCVMPVSPSTASTATPGQVADAATLPPLSAIELADGARLQVVASTNIVAEVVAQVGGDQIDLIPLIPTGADPHSFTTTPQDLITLNQAQVIFINGLQLEESLMSVLESLDNDAPIVSVNVGVETEEFGPSAVEHACKHLAEGPEVTVSAAAEIAATTAVTGTHVRLDVTLPDAAPSYFAYTAEEAGEYVFYADSPVTLTLSDADGNATPAETVMDAAVLADCPGFVTAFVFDLVAGDNVLSIQEADDEMARFVVEEVAGEHEHGAHEDEAHADEDHAADHAEEEAADAHEHDDAEAGEEDHHHHEGINPHTWFSIHAVEQWVSNIEQVLSTVDPANAATYAANADAYRAELATLESELDAMVAELPVEQRKLVTDHEALGYFAATYDFEVIGAVIPASSTMASPSANELAALQDQIEAEGVPAIFVGVSVNADLAEQLAADTGAKVATIYSESLSAADGPAPTYLDLMRYNMRTIVDALK